MCKTMNPVLKHNLCSDFAIFLSSFIASPCETCDTCLRGKKWCFPWGKKIEYISFYLFTTFVPHIFAEWYFTFACNFIEKRKRVFCNTCAMCCSLLAQFVSFYCNISFQFKLLTACQMFITFNFHFFKVFFVRWQYDYLFCVQIFL